MGKCGIDKPIWIMIHNSNLYYCLEQLKLTVPENNAYCIESQGTKKRRFNLNFNHPAKEFVYATLTT